MMLSSMVRVLLRRCGNRLARVCPNNIFDTWKLRRRILAEGGKIAVLQRGEGRRLILIGTTSGGLSIVFRENATDALILYEVLWRAQYRSVAVILRHLGIVPASVLDGGANIGAFTMYMKRLFPEVAIVWGAIPFCVANWKNCERIWELQ